MSDTPDIDATGWLPNLTGPLDLQVDGVAVDVPRRPVVNLIGATIEDDPTYVDEEGNPSGRTNITPGSGGSGGGTVTAGSNVGTPTDAVNHSGTFNYGKPFFALSGTTMQFGIIEGAGGILVQTNTATGKMVVSPNGLITGAQNRGGGTFGPFAGLNGDGVTLDYGSLDPIAPLAMTPHAGSGEGAYRLDLKITPSATGKDLLRTNSGATALEWISGAWIPTSNSGGLPTYAWTINDANTGGAWRKVAFVDSSLGAGYAQFSGATSGELAADGGNANVFSTGNMVVSSLGGGSDPSSIYLHNAAVEFIGAGGVARGGFFPGSTRTIIKDITTWVNTTDATTTTVYSETIPDDYASVIEGALVAVATDGSKSGVWYRKLRVKRVSGTVTAGSVFDSSQDDADGMTSAAYTIDVSGTTFRHRWTGLVATTIKTDIDSRMHSRFRTF